MVSPPTAHAEEALGEAAFFDEGGGLGFQLAIEEVTAKVQEREGGVGHPFGGRGHGLTRTGTDWHGRGLHHLIVGTAASLDVAIAETHGDVIDQLGYKRLLIKPSL